VLIPAKTKMNVSGWLENQENEHIHGGINFCQPNRDENIF
jgi:hypothetical protein